MAVSKASFRLRLDEKAHQKAKQIAAREFRSPNAQFEYFIAKGIEQYKQEQDKLPPAEDK